MVTEDPRLHCGAITALKPAKSEYVELGLLSLKYGMLGLWEELILLGLEMLE